jgi:hypothetical protein
MTRAGGSDRRNIFRVRFRLANGKTIIRYVRCPYWERDAEASVQGLHGRLANLTASGAIISATVSAPENPRHLKVCIKAREAKVPGHRCDCFHRWTEIPELAAA